MAKQVMKDGKEDNDGGDIDEDGKNAVTGTECSSCQCSSRRIE